MKMVTSFNNFRFVGKNFAWGLRTWWGVGLVSLCDMVPGQAWRKGLWARIRALFPSAETKYLGLSFLGLADPGSPLVCPLWLLGQCREKGETAPGKAGRGLRLITAGSA